MPAAERPAALIITWSRNTGANGRADDMARVLGGTVLTVHPFAGLGAARKLARYAASMPLTIASTVRARPAAVVAQSPPVFCALAGSAAARILRVPFVLDAHPGAFGLMGDALSARLQWLMRRLARRATGTLVTEQSLAAQVERWSGQPIVFHETPPAWSIAPRAERAGERLKIFYVGIFQPDEPVELVIEAARALPGVDFVVTGEHAKAPAGLIEGAPANVEFCGYLDEAGYVRALEGSDAVLVLTTEPTSVARSGYDAVWANRPLVITGADAGKDAFPFASHVENTAASIVERVSGLVDDLPARSADAVRARAHAEERWSGQQAALQRAVSGA